MEKTFIRETPFVVNKMESADSAPRMDKKEVMKNINQDKSEVEKIPSWLPISLIYRDPSTGEIVDFGNCKSYIEAIRMQETLVRSHTDFERCNNSLALQLPTPYKPIRDYDFKEIKAFLSKMMTRYCSITFKKYPNYGVPEELPSWWPTGVLWTRKGIQQGLNITQMHRIAFACFRHYGRPLEGDYDNGYFHFNVW